MNKAQDRFDLPQVRSADDRIHDHRRDVAAQGQILRAVPPRRNPPVVSVATPDVAGTTRTSTEVEHDTPRVAHIVYPASAVVEALITGSTVTALCGHTWVPGRDPLQYPLCQACKEIAAGMGWQVPSC